MFAVPKRERVFHGLRHKEPLTITITTIEEKPHRKRFLSLFKLARINEIVLLTNKASYLAKPFSEHLCGSRCLFFQVNEMEKIFKPHPTRHTLVWGLLLLAIINIPLFLIFSFAHFRLPLPAHF